MNDKSMAIKQSMIQRYVYKWMNEVSVDFFRPGNFFFNTAAISDEVLDK